MVLIMMCQSERHDGTKGNGYYYHTNPPPLCPSCGDPWLPKSIFNPECQQNAKELAVKLKQQPHVNTNGDIILQDMYFTDEELFEIVERDRKRDVIKASLAAQYMLLRSEARRLADMEWTVDDKKFVNAKWVAMSLSTALKWIDFWSRGIPIYWSK